MSCTKNSTIKIFRGNADEVNKQPIIDKQFVIDIETPCFYIDVKKSRIPFGKNVDIDTNKIWEAIRKIEEDIKNSTSAIPEEKIETLINEKITENINSDDGPIASKINEINQILESSKKYEEQLEEKLEKIETVEAEIESIKEEIEDIVESKQESVFNIDDILYVDKWDLIDDGDSFIHEYYYTNEAIPSGAIVTFIPIVTNSNEYINLTNANLLTAIEYDAEKEYYIIRSLNVPQDDIEICVTVTPQ